MTDTITMALVVACLALILAIIAIIFAWLTRRDKVKAIEKL